MSYTNTIDEVLLRRKHKLTIAKNQNENAVGRTEKAMIAAMMKNIASLGFVFSSDVLDVLFTYTRPDIEEFYKDLLPKLKALVGADVEYNPMYPNFPQQVMEASDIELFFNAIVHYVTSGTLMPEYEKDLRMPLFDADKMTVLSLGQVTDVFGIFQNILGGKTSISPQDREDVEKIVENYADFYNYLPEEIPMKENAALVAMIVANKAAIKNSGAIQKYFKTATDVLRFVVAISGGDISLASATTFKHMRRCERRMVMDLLAGCGDILEDMYRYQYEWIRVGEIVHPGTYKSKRYVNVNKAFDNLRNGTKPMFLPGQIQSAIKRGDMKLASDLLMYRPGDFARQLDKVLRDSDNKNYVVNCFNNIAENVSTNVLLQVRQHFIHRNNLPPIRVFFPKGNLARAMHVKNELPGIDQKYCDAIVKICDNALMSQYKEREFMGNVYIDECMKNYLVPFSQRSASKSNKIVVRGSKLPVNDAATAVRAFIWWTNMGKEDFGRRIDIDLSATVFDANWGYMEHVSYTNLRSHKFNMCHSGDIVDGGDADGAGAAEFIDIDIERANDLDARYIVFQVYSYCDVNFGSMPNCRFGWMEREDVNSGEIFEPSTVEMKIDLTAESTVAIPVIFDIYERKFVWCDMNLSMNSVGSHYGGINLESNMNNVIATCYAMVNLNKPNLYDLIMLNAKARGNIVSSREEADVIFSNDTEKPIVDVEIQDQATGHKHTVELPKDCQIVTAFDCDYFMGQLI